MTKLDANTRATTIVPGWEFFGRVAVVESSVAFLRKEFKHFEGKFTVGDESDMRPVEINLLGFTENLLEKTLMCTPTSPEGGGRSAPSVFSRDGSLRPSSYADARSPDDVIAF